MVASVSALLAIGNVPPSSGGIATASQGEADDFFSQPFSQLLGDLAQEGGDQSQPFSKNGFTNTSLNALLAQDLTPPTLSEVEKANASAQQPISLDDLAQMLKKVEALLAHAQERADRQSKTAADLLKQVKAGLLQLKEAGQPVTTAQVLEKVPQLKDVLLAHPSLKAHEHADQTEKHEEEEGSAQLSALLQSLPASLFRVARREASQAEAAARKEAKASEGHLDILGAEQVIVIHPAAMLQRVNASQTEAEISEGVVSETPTQVQRALSSIELPKLTARMEAQAQQRSAALAHSEAHAVQQAATAAATKTERDANFMGERADDLSVGTTSAPTTATVAAPVPHVAKPAPVVNLIPTPGHVNHAPVSEQVHVAIRQAAKDGMDHITIQLEPADLGRVEVNLQRSADGQTQISFLVDRADTFDHLSRDARALERSLQEAGIKADTGSMQFNLRQQPQPQMQSGLNSDGQNQGNPSTDDDAEEISAVSAPSVATLAALTRHYTINIREGVDISA